MNSKIIICSGALVYARSTKRFLLLHRTQGRAKDVWGLVGGTTEEKETPWEGLRREIVEEIGEVEIKKTIPLETFISNDDKFHFHTFLCVVDEEFIPNLNNEHNGYAWTTFKSWKLILVKILYIIIRTIFSHVFLGRNCVYSCASITNLSYHP